MNYAVLKSSILYIMVPMIFVALFTPLIKKVAFHIIIENLESQPKEVSDLIKKVNLKAGDENLEEVETNTDENFCKVVQGKASYNSIAKYTSILPNDKTSGYIGFEVPENEENLKFIINDSEIIEIKNPVFKEN